MCEKLIKIGAVSPHVVVRARVFARFFLRAQVFNIQHRGGALERKGNCFRGEKVDFSRFRFLPGAVRFILTQFKRKTIRNLRVQGINCRKDEKNYFEGCLLGTVTHF